MLETEEFAFDLDRFTERTVSSPLEGRRSLGTGSLEWYDSSGPVPKGRGPSEGSDRGWGSDLMCEEERQGYRGSRMRTLILSDIIYKKCFQIVDGGSDLTHKELPSSV